MNKELLERLKEECFIRNLSAKTCKIYEYHIDKYLEWADKSVEDLALYDARSYILEFKGSKCGEPLITFRIGGRYMLC